MSETLYTGLPPFVDKGFEHVECISVVFLRKNSENHTKAAWIRTNLYESARSGLCVCSVLAGSQDGPRYASAPSGLPVCSVQTIDAED